MSEVALSPIHLLEQDGSLVEGAQPTLSDEQTVEALRLMLLSRLADERGTGLQRQNKLGIWSPVKGQEASVVGTCMALDPARDWLVPAYRELPAVVRHGMPLDRIFAGAMGKTPSAAVPDDVLTLPSQVALATQIQHAVGIAWGLKLQKDPGVVMVYFGEGASSEGDFHEAMNLAGVLSAPIVFVLQNNQWAISTSRAAQSAGQFFERARGYGFPGIQVDGNDLFACYGAAANAVARARAGEGPTLIETITYRLSFHNTTDNPRNYLPEGWLDDAEAHDPIPRVEGFLARRGLWDAPARTAMEAEIREQIDAAVDSAFAMPEPVPGDLFDNVYATPTPRVLAQRDELLHPNGEAPHG